MFFPNQIHDFKCGHIKVAITETSFCTWSEEHCWEQQRKSVIVPTVNNRSQSVNDRQTIGQQSTDNRLTIGRFALLSVYTSSQSHQTTYQLLPRHPLKLMSGSWSTVPHSVREPESLDKNWDVTIIQNGRLICLNEVSSCFVFKLQ